MTTTETSLWYAWTNNRRLHLLPTVMHRTICVAIILLPAIASAQQGTVRYTHSYSTMAFPTDQLNELFLKEGIGDPKWSPLDSGEFSLARVLEFDPSSSLMYPDSGVSFRPGSRTARPGSRTADSMEVGWEFVDSTYVDLNSNTFVESRKFYRSKYIVKGELPSVPWQLTTDERTYLEYRVMKATAIVDSAVVEAWFTPDIPISAGPGLYGGLPGVILMVTSVGRGEVYAAEAVDLVDVVPSIRHTQPTVGREMSPEKYDQRVASVIAENQRKWEIARKAVITSVPGN